MDKHPDCAEVCKQANDYGVWPEHSCKPTCVWLEKHPVKPIGFIPRNDPSLIIVPNWAEFIEWAKDAGYPESDLDINHCRCLALQQTYLEEQAHG
jgi:hypothetical protein